MVQARQVARIVAGFDRRQPVPCGDRILTDRTLARPIVHHEADMRAAPALVQRSSGRLGPGYALRPVLGPVVDGTTTASIRLSL